MQQPIDVTPVRPLFHNKAGQLFEPDKYQLGLARCSRCLALVAPEQADAHQCDDLMLVLAAVIRESEAPHG